MKKKKKKTANSKKRKLWYSRGAENATAAGLAHSSGRENGQSGDHWRSLAQRFVVLGPLYSTPLHILGMACLILLDLGCQE